MYEGDYLTEFKCLVYKQISIVYFSAYCVSCDGRDRKLSQDKYNRYCYIYTLFRYAYKYTGNIYLVNIENKDKSCP